MRLQPPTDQQMPNAQDRPGGHRTPASLALLFGQVVGMAPGDERVRYIGGDYPTEWLRDQVDSGRADLAVLIAPVSVADFVRVNVARQRMPCKSTWFVPKARAGLVLARVAAQR